MDEERAADLEETIPEEGWPEPVEAEDIPLTPDPPPDEGDDGAEAKEDGRV